MEAPPGILQAAVSLLMKDRAGQSDLFQADAGYEAFVLFEAKRLKSAEFICEAEIRDI